MYQHAVMQCNDAATLELQVETVKYFKDTEKNAGNVLPDF